MATRNTANIFVRPKATQQYGIETNFKPP